MVTRWLFGPRVGREATWTVHPVASRGIRGPRPRRLRFYYLTDQRKARAPMDGRDRELCPPGGRGGRWAHVAHMGARRGVSCSALPVAVTAVKKIVQGWDGRPHLHCSSCRGDAGSTRARVALLPARQGVAQVAQVAQLA